MEALRPLVRAIIYEVTPGEWEPSFVAEPLPDELAIGRLLRGKVIFYSGVTPTSSTMIVVTASRNHPKWLADPGLDSSEYELHLFTWSPATHVGQPHIFTVNSENLAVAREVMRAVGADEVCRLADPGAVQEAVDSIDRSSVSNVGVRNTFMTGRGTASYRTYAGSGVDRGIRAADMAYSALGHAMAQVTDEAGSFNIGIATAKAKYWESRYVRLREYENTIEDFVSRYRVPPSATGTRAAAPYADTRGETQGVSLCPHRRYRDEPSPSRTRVADWWRGHRFARLLPHRSGPSDAGKRIEIAAAAPRLNDAVVWKGWQGVDGAVHEDVESASAQRGYGSTDPWQICSPSIRCPCTSAMAPSYTARPTTSVLASRGTCRQSRRFTIDWSPYEITVETKKSAQDKTSKPSVHQALEDWLRAQPRRLRHRWIFCNDGQGELADYVVIEAGPGPSAHLALWHAKASSANKPGVRVGDMEVVITQAFKSRRWAGDAGLWRTLRQRYLGLEAPKLDLIEGRPRLFEALCGVVGDNPRYSFDRYPPAVSCEIGIVQPGLSYGKLREGMNATEPELAHQQVRDFLAVCHDAISDAGELRLIGSP